MSKLAMTEPNSLTISEPIQPGATIGMVGGGQLGRMFAMAAAAMGYHVVVFCESNDAPAAQVAHRTVVGKLDDQAAVEQFASQCDVITLEFENIPAETIAKCGEFAPTFPAASVLATAQDRLLEKSTLREAGLPVTPFAKVANAEELIQVSEELGWPMIVKTARSGYDGKGQHRVESADQAGDVPWSSFDDWIAERCIAFELEVSVVVARNTNSQSACFPVFENSHHNHILDVSVVPASVSDSVIEQAKSVAQSAADTLDVVGLLCVEFFVSDGSVMINEVAPRPHNSGHLTIEGCHTSQFEQHVRAICNLPFGDTSLRSGAAAMANLLGDLWPDESGPKWSAALAVDGVSLHLYGKADAKRGRKMGHLTAVGQNREEVEQRVLAARNHLKSK